MMFESREGLDELEILRRRINVLSSQICRAKDPVQREAWIVERASLQAQRKALKSGAKPAKPAPAPAPAPKPAKPKARHSIPRNPSRTGIKFDVKAIERAIEELGITRPVKIKRTAGRNRRGTCALRGFMDPQIVITCSTEFGPEDVSRILWHELTHAKQMESYSTLYSYMVEYKKYGYNGRAYWNNPYEVEAREVADIKVAEGKILASAPAGAHYARY